MLYKSVSPDGSKRWKQITLMSSKDRDRFRETPEWMEFRKSLYIQRLGICDLCGKKLKGVWNCHHMNSNKTMYQQLNPQHFMILHKQCHTILHDILKIKPQSGSLLYQLQQFWKPLYTNLGL
jgi:hypothetical protein